MPPPVRSAEREGRPNRRGQKRCGRRRRARMPIPSAEDSADAVRIFYCIQGGTAHNVRDNDVCVRCENKREEHPNRRGRRRRGCMPIPPADGSAGAVRIFYCIRGETAHNGRSDGSCARREKKKGRGVSPLQQVLEKPLMRSCPAPQPCPTLMGRT